MGQGGAWGKAGANNHGHLSYPGVKDKHWEGAIVSLQGRDLQLRTNLGLFWDNFQIIVIKGIGGQRWTPPPGPGGGYLTKLKHVLVFLHLSPSHENNHIGCQKTVAK